MKTKNIEFCNYGINSKALNRLPVNIKTNNSNSNVATVLMEKKIN